MANEPNLTKFEPGDQRAKELGRQGGLARARNAAARKAKEAGTVAEWKHAMESVATAFNRENAAAVANMLLARIAKGEIEITGRDVSGLLDVLVQVVRLEEGLATSHTLTVQGEAVIDRIARLRAEHNERTEAGPIIETTEGCPPRGQGGTPGSGASNSL